MVGSVSVWVKVISCWFWGSLLFMEAIFGGCVVRFDEGWMKYFVDVYDLLGLCIGKRKERNRYVWQMVEVGKMGKKRNTNLDIDKIT